ncbi:MAG: rRNA maturation RNase YbeY [Candidatus Niameybacter stercoravium]|nr:rRNA maturation RNase YbeY [Candidatus Niameybacter stercoravium]
MNLYLEDEYNFFEKHEDLFEEVQKVIAKCLEVEKVPYESEISLTVVDKEEIRSINHEHRDIDRATDVLSFPQIDPESNGIIDWGNLDETEVMNYDTNHIMLGDIVLCYEVADEQAKSYGHSLKREVCFLVAHSMFHLLGYDHMNEEDEKLMIAKQNEVLSNLGINR